MLKKIIKRNGTIEDFIPHKLNKWAEWAGEKLGDRVDWSTVVLETVQNFNDITTSKELQYKLIDSCLAMQDWPHNSMAGRLLGATLHKEVYPDGIPTVEELVYKLSELGVMVNLSYSKDEYELIENMIDHTRDFNLAQFQLSHIKNRYSLDNKITGEVYETAQFAYMRLALVLAETEPKENRLQLVEDYYDCFSKNHVNLPTNDFINLGTGHNGLASCCLIHAGDTVDSIGIGNFIAYRMTAMSAGIGFFLNTRSLGDSVRNGSIVHQGKLPYKALTGKGVKANLQKGRGGACTDFFQAMDPEASTMIQLQSIRSTEDTQNRDMHFAILFNKFVGEKAMRNEEIFQFNSFTAPDLFESLYGKDINDFIKLYDKYEKDITFKKTYINARKLVIETLKQTHEVATNYYGFIDEINRHTPFIEKIFSSNLCMEITQPTYPYFKMTDLYQLKDNGIMRFKDFEDNEITIPYSDVIINKAGKKTFAGNLQTGIDFKELIEKTPTSEVSLCSLGAVVIVNIKSDEDYARACYLLLKKIDRCIHMSDYPLPHIGWTAKNRMNAGVGIIGLAYHLAKKNIRYDSQEGLDEVHRVFERHAFFMIQQSLRIAKERGLAPWIHKTKWPEGWLPIDTYKKSVDELSNVPLQYDWESLRKDIIEFGGIGHSSLIAHMPTETSSKASGVPNGLYPIRELSMLKTDYSNVIEWCAPDGDILSEQYDIAWDVPTLALNKIYAVAQKFTDQSISADAYADRIKKPELSTKEMLNIFFNQIKYGQKTQYYQNALTKDKEEDIKNNKEILDSIRASDDENKIFIDVSSRREKQVCDGGACDV